MKADTLLPVPPRSLGVRKKMRQGHLELCLNWLMTMNAGRKQL